MFAAVLEVFVTTFSRLPVFSCILLLKSLAEMMFAVFCSIYVHLAEFGVVNILDDVTHSFHCVGIEM